jgi:two-component system NtrC family sensor kinase
MGNVVLIDDSSVVLDRLRAALAASGFQVRTTPDTNEAPRLVPDADLVIVDYHMPGMNGGTLLPALKHAARPEQVCLFYLYTSDAEIARKYESLGFDGGLIRKGDAKALIPQVEAAFRTIKMRKLALEMKARRSDPAK